MNRCFTLFLWIPLLIQQGYTQTPPYVHHIEMGALVGTGNDGAQRVDYSVSIFKGVKPHPSHEFGFMIGLDSYPGFRLMPLGLGWRGIAHTGRKFSPFVSIDLGYGSSMFNRKSRENQLESWYDGGKLINAALGIRKKSPNRRHSYTWSLGFKKQRATYYEGIRSAEITQQSNNPLLPRGFVSLREENYILNSLFLKWGIIF